jgi:hypothetical protein
LGRATQIHWHWPSWLAAVREAAQAQVRRAPSPKQNRKRATFSFFVSRFPGSVICFICEIAILDSFTGTPPKKKNPEIFASSPKQARVRSYFGAAFSRFWAFLSS